MISMPQVLKGTCLDTLHFHGNHDSLTAIAWADISARHGNEKKLATN